LNKEEKAVINNLQNYLLGIEIQIKRIAEIMEAEAIRKRGFGRYTKNE